jgi:chromosome segregation ATPase
MQEIDNKLLKIDVEISNIENNIKSNEKLYENTLTEEEKNNQKVINEYNGIIEKYDELEKYLNIIKEEQNKIGVELMTSAINNNNYEEEILKVENKLNLFSDEQDIKFNNTLNQIYNNNIENIENKEKEIQLIKSDINNTQEMINNLKMNLNPINEIPLIRNNINKLDEKMGEIKIKYEKIVKDHENIDIKNNEMRQSLSNANKDINEINNQIEQNHINIEDIKNNYIKKTDIKDINERINKINEEINIIQKNYEKNINILNNAKNDLKDINKNNEELILKEEHDKEVAKKQNEFDELKNNC